MSEGETNAARRAALQRVLEPGEELLWWAEPSAAPKSVWLVGCIAGPFLFIGIIMLIIGVGTGMGGPDPYTGYRLPVLFGVVGAVFTGLGLLLIRLPMRLKARYLDAIYGMTNQRVVQVLDATGSAKVQSAPFERVLSVAADAERDGTGTLTIRVMRRRFSGGRNRDLPEIWLIPGVSQVDAVRASLEQWVANARQ